MDDLDLEAYAAELERQDREYRAKLTPKQLRDYRILGGEIAARCPRCGSLDVEIEHKEQPDMIGVNSWVFYECCGYNSEPRNSHCEYDANGRVTDVN